MASSYADLEIRILPSEGSGYPVELTLNNEQEFEQGFVDGSQIPWQPSLSFDEDRTRLSNWFFADERLRRAWAEVRGQAPHRQVRLRIDAQAPELHRLPWELLATPDETNQAQLLSASTATPFSRYLAGRWRHGRPVLQRPIRVLVAIANPRGLDAYNLIALNPEQELDLLRKATEGLDVELEVLPEPCTLAAVEAALRSGYHVLHFVGHGMVGESTGQAALFLATDDNTVALVKDDEIAGMVERQLGEGNRDEDDQLRMVFLASCQTATRSARDAFSGLAPRLVAAGVPAVLAMQERVDVNTAQQFAAVFYRQLLSHGLVDLACNEARSAIISSKLPGEAVPVLFSRLKGSRLLAQRGRITSSNEDLFWPFLLENIDRGTCTPFLGPGVNSGLLPDAQSMAEKLADKYLYPLPDRRRLVRVAQYMALIDPDLLRADYMRLLQRSLFRYLEVEPDPQEKRRLQRATFTETAEALNWAERVLAMYEGEIHHLLADLQLPLYVTTNVDNFMVEALKGGNGATPRRIGPRWELPAAGTPEFVLLPEPSPEAPVVLHLNGHDGDAEQLRHLVLSEDDYLAHFVRLSRDQETILPMNVLGMLSQQSFLFLGYQLEDWEFRTILQGLIRSLPQNVRDSRKVHVGVQLEPDEELRSDKAMEYLARYLGSFNIDIYWGTPQQFVTELHSRWSAYLKSDDWGF